MKKLKTKIFLVLAFVLLFGFNQPVLAAIPQECLDSGVTDEDVCFSNLGLDPSNQGDVLVFQYKSVYKNYKSCLDATSNPTGCSKAFPDEGRSAGSQSNTENSRSSGTGSTKPVDYASCMRIVTDFNKCCQQFKDDPAAKAVCSSGAPPNNSVTQNPPQNTKSNSGCGNPQLKMVNGICVPENTTGGGFATVESLEELLLKVLTMLLGFAGIAAVLYLIWGGYLYITSGGNEEQAEKGQKALTNAIIGVVIIIMAYTIVNVVIKTLNT